MESYSQHDSNGRKLYENYTSRPNQSISKDLQTPLTTSRTNMSQRLPKVNPFSSFLQKSKDNELAPTLHPHRKTQKAANSRKQSAQLRKKHLEPSLNGKFYSGQGLNLKHPELPMQIRKILNLIEMHQMRCDRNLIQADFKLLKRHFC